MNNVLDPAQMSWMTKITNLKTMAQVTRHFLEFYNGKNCIKLSKVITIQSSFEILIHRGKNLS